MTTNLHHTNWDSMSTPAKNLALHLYHRLPGDLMPQLAPAAARLQHTAGDAHTAHRGQTVIDWVARTVVPAWLDAAGHPGHANTLRDHAPLTGAGDPASLVRALNTAAACDPDTDLDREAERHVRDLVYNTHYLGFTDMPGVRPSVLDGVDGRVVAAVARAADAAVRAAVTRAVLSAGATAGERSAAVRRVRRPLARRLHVSALGVLAGMPAAAGVSR